MAKTKKRPGSDNQRSGTGQLPAPGRTEPSRQNRLATQNRMPGRRGKSIQIAVLALLVGLALISWRAWSVTRDDDTAQSDAGIPSIASIVSRDVHSLIIDPADPDHVIFGSHAGTQESWDGGYSWEGGGLNNADAMSLAVSSIAPSTVFAAGHDVFQVSRDGGNTWQPLPNDLPGTDIHGFAQDPVEPLRLYAFVVNAGLFTTEDGGTTWFPLPTQPPGIGMHVTLAATGSLLYAATASGILTSADLGASWQPLATQPGGTVVSLAIPEANPDVIYAGTQNGLAKSTDGGASWTALGPPDTVVLALAIAPTNPDRVLFVNDRGQLYRSDDGGASWLAPE